MEGELTTLQDIPIPLDVAALAEKYRVRPGDQARDFEALVAEVQHIGRPKALCEVVYIDEKGDDWVSAGGARFTSRALRKNLDQAERLFPYVATCGAEVDKLNSTHDDIRRKAWLYMLKGELLQIAVARVEEHIGRHHQIAKLATMNPGSGDAAVWPLQQQEELFSLLGDVEGRIGVRLTESWLLIPEISVSGVYFPTAGDFQSCQVCHRENCPGRRAPFSPETWEALCEDQVQESHKEFIAEVITPLEGSFTTAAMAAGEPGLPRRFRWRGTDYEVARVLETWKTTGPCRHGSGEQYVRKHWFRILTSGGTEMDIYFDRQARTPQKSHRWWLAAIVRTPHD